MFSPTPTIVTTQTQGTSGSVLKTALSLSKALRGLRPTYPRILLVTNYFGVAKRRGLFVGWDFFPKFLLGCTLNSHDFPMFEKYPWTWKPEFRLLWQNPIWIPINRITSKSLAEMSLSTQYAQLIGANQPPTNCNCSFARDFSRENGHLKSSFAHDQHSPARF